MYLSIENINSSGYPFPLQEYSVNYDTHNQTYVTIEVSVSFYSNDLHCDVSELVLGGSKSEMCLWDSGNFLILYGAFITGIQHNMEGRIDVDISCDYHTNSDKSPDWMLANRREEIIDQLLKD